MLGEGCGQTSGGKQAFMGMAWTFIRDSVAVADRTERSKKGVWVLSNASISQLTATDSNPGGLQRSQSWKVPEVLRLCRAKCKTEKS